LKISSNFELKSLYETLDDNKRGNPRLSVGVPKELALDKALNEACCRFYLPKGYTATDGKYDTACLKAILNNCLVFDGWFVPQGEGWFQKFHTVGQVRNQVVGHNATQRIEASEALAYLSTIQDMFPQLFEIFSELKDVECRVKRCHECCDEIEKITFATIDAILEISDDPKIVK
jgi:hypothetical protein